MPIAFLNAALLAGLAAIALPPIIHLLTRKKFDVAPWAAMQFLDDGNRTRRRMIWDELLLMAVRIGAIASGARAGGAVGDRRLARAFSPGAGAGYRADHRSLR